MNWWSRYLIDTDRVTAGYDLTDWALPFQIAVGRCNLHLRVLCFDIDLYWGETYD